MRNFTQITGKNLVTTASLAGALAIGGAIGCSKSKQALTLPPAGVPLAESADRFVVDSKVIPQYPRGDATFTVGDLKVADPYASMRDGTNALLLSFLRTNNAVATHTLTNGVCGFASKMISEVVSIGARYTPFHRGDTFTWIARRPGEEQAVCWRVTGKNNEPSAYFDPNKLYPDASFQIVHDPEAPNGILSPQGDRALVCLVPKGTEDKIWRVVNVSSGEISPFKVENCMLSLAVWSPSGDAFFTSQYPSAQATTNQNVVKCILPSGDKQGSVVSIYNRADLPEANFDPALTTDGRYAVITIWAGANPANGVALVDLSGNTFASNEIWEHSKAACTYIGDTGTQLYFLSDNKILSFNTAAMSEGFKELPLPQLAHNEIRRSVTHIGNGFLVHKLVDGISALEILDLQGTRIKEVQLPGAGEVSDIKYSGSRGEFFFEYSSGDVSQKIFQAQFDGKGLVQKLWFEPKSKFDYSTYTTELLFADGPGGIRIPMYVSAPRGIKRDGNNPALIYAYGGYGSVTGAGFDARILPLMKIGELCGENVVFVRAELPGGGVYGDQWTAMGTGTNKTVTVDSLAAVARSLQARGVTSPERTVLSGGSLGGLVVSATAIRYPQLFAGVVTDVPFVDPISYQLGLNNTTHVNELGDASDPAQLAAMLKFSPIHMLAQLPAGMKPPAFYITAGFADERVPVCNPASLAAALQDKGAVCLLNTNFDEGHGYIAHGTAASYLKFGMACEAFRLMTRMRLQHSR
jgi:prolyl oligopeptidase